MYRLLASSFIALTLSGCGDSQWDGPTAVHAPFPEVSEDVKGQVEALCSDQKSRDSDAPVDLPLRLVVADANFPDWWTSEQTEQMIRSAVYEFDRRMPSGRSGVEWLCLFGDDSQVGCPEGSEGDLMAVIWGKGACHSDAGWVAGCFDGNIHVRGHGVDQAPGDTLHHEILHAYGLSHGDMDLCGQGEQSIFYDRHLRVLERKYPST